MANTFRVSEFRNNTPLTYAVIGLLSAAAFVSAMFALFSFLMVLMPDWVLDFGDGEPPLPVALSIVGLFAIIEIPLRVITVVVFLIWLYRAYSNLSPLNARNLEFSPGWAVGWWFIPFANLVKPFQVVREVYNESSADFDPDSGFTTMPPGTPLEIGAWWATFIVSGFLYRLSDKLFGNGETPASEYFATVFLAGALCSTVAAVLAAYIVKAVNSRQIARLAIVGANSGPMDTPPAPPVFDQDL